MRSFHIFLPIIYFTILRLVNGNSIELNRNYTGVQFSPYVKNGEGLDSIPDRAQYTLNEVKAMLEVVSTKFSRVITETVDALDVSYEPNATYYDSAYIIARTAEAAALINREKNDTFLTVIIGIKRYDDDFGGENRTATEVDVAIEALEIANRIYPGTTEGFQLSNVLSDQASAHLGSRWVEHLRNRTEGVALRIGAHVHLDDLTELNRKRVFESPHSHQEPITHLIKMSDFIICKFEVKNNLALNKGKENFAFHGTMVLAQMNQIRSKNQNATVMGSTGWASEGDQVFQTVDNLRDYWIEINRFAVDNDFFIWLEEAFDNPLHSGKDIAHKGWWRLTKNELANNASGYVEKVLEPRKTQEEDLPTAQILGVWTWVSVGVFVGSIIIVTLVGALIYLYRKMTTLKKALTKEEIREFKYGTSDKYADIEAEDEIVCGKAMKKPYDQNLEISEDSLEIYWSQILGTGEFGCVFKALWKCSNPKEVALKTTKRNCPSSALRGILSEIKILTHLGQHPNVVSICGAYTAELAKGKVYLATELCEMGSLKNYLTRLNTIIRSSSIYENIMTNQENLMRWSFEIASGMEHLENMGVIHADLATRNVLLSSDATAKISDFGLSRRLYDYSNYVKQQQEPLPWRWMAIESLKMMLFSHRSDTWSYGITLWEIFSFGSEPYPGLSWSIDFVDRLEDGLRMKKPRLASPELYDLMLDCWHTQPARRPNFTRLKDALLNVCTKYSYVNVRKSDSLA